MAFKIIKKQIGGARGIYQAPKNELLRVFGPALTAKFISFRNKFDPVAELNRLRKNNIVILPVDGDDYPESLKNIEDPPICLYVKGNTEVLKARDQKFFDGKQKTAKNLVPSLMQIDSIHFAIVGTRKPTPYGIQVAKKFAYELAGDGFVIVSGLAMGIDTIAHQSALDAQGKTIAVLGCGVNIIYPAVNRVLYENIIAAGGAVISEFPPDQMALKGMFVARNRIISGLSKGVLIVEGLKDSGALITARFAGEQGKEVFAPPSPITSEMSAAPNLLIKQGAKPVTSVGDIYEEFDMKITPRKKEDIRSLLNETEKLIYDILEKNPISADEISSSLGKPINEILKVISIMEINGIVEKNQDNCYQIRLSHQS